MIRGVSVRGWRIIRNDEKEEIMKRLTRLAALCLMLFVGCAFTLPAHMGTLESYAAAKVKISKTKATVIKGKTVQLKMKGTKAKVKWSSSKKSIATVNKKGKVTAKKPGKATITAKIGKKKYKCKITVKNPTTKLNKTSLTLQVGSSYTLKASSNGKSKKATWTSSNPAVAAVNASGAVTAKAAGTAKVTVKMNGASKVCSVTVKEAAVNPASDYVYVSATGRKYHRVATCSNMASPQKILLSDAKKQGYEPCAKCY